MAPMLSENPEQPTKWSAGNPWKDSKSTPGAFPSSPQNDNTLEIVGQRSLAAAVRERRQDYVRKKNIKIKVGTWNVAAIRNTHKDLPLWFLQGLGVRGLNQDLAGFSIIDGSESSDDEQIESVEQQESRSSGGKQATVPKGEIAVAPSEDAFGIYVLGLQEVIDISSVTEAMRPYYDPNPSKKWKRSIKKSLPYGYEKVAEQQLLGLLILVYAAPDVASEITSVDCQSVGTGMLGYMGNKGAVSVRMVLGSMTRLLFVNCHLAAGADQAALTRRIWDTNQVLSRTKFEAAVIDGETNIHGPESIGDEDFAFWFGDLNFRLDNIPGEDVRRLLLLHTRNEYDVLNKTRRRIDSELGYIDPPPSSGTNVAVPDEQEGDGGKPANYSSIEPELDPKNDPASLITTLNSLLQHDQLRAQQRSQKAFHDGWREGEIGFLPTYKYDVGSVGMFDSGEKKRSPSWCDRILYRTRQDKLNHEDRLRGETEARKKDEEMKAKGLDAAAAEQEVLFDYDPETDGADNDDEYDENEDVQDTHSAITEEVSQDTITLESYISHQRVLSSDHKPLSAIFSITYDAVIPELKQQVQQEAARLLDKNENDTRPNVTVVVDNASESTANADNTTGASELNSVEFGNIRYGMPQTRSLTIANTGPIPATFAFIDRPEIEGKEHGPSPSWMNIEIHHESQPTPKEKDDLGLSTRFILSPGDVAMVDMTVNIIKPELVCALNERTEQIDDILVLRILNGRDHFISVRGNWLPSCFYRNLEELVRFPRGVRSKSSTPDNDGVKVRRPSEIYHSAPKELFELTESLPGLVERAVADWTMTNQDMASPWNTDPSWPFQGHGFKDKDVKWAAQLTDLREALDTATPLHEHFDAQLPPLARAELIGETLVLFLHSLRDGIVPSTACQDIEKKLVAVEKTKTTNDMDAIRDIVMEALSNTPVHSVSLTFITFMFTRIITELISTVTDTVQSPASTTSRRARSATEASDAPSELSMASIDSTTSRSSFLPSLGRRKPTATNVVTTSSVPTASERKMKHIDAYSELFASIIFRSEGDTQLKMKDKRASDARKKRVLVALLDSPSM